MGLHLPRLNQSNRIVSDEGTPTSVFMRGFHNILDRIEGAIDNIVDILVRLGLVETTANGALTLADGAIEGVTFQIKGSKVVTDSMADMAATVISSLYYNAGGAALGTGGSYVDLPSGPAVISIACGTKATQQCFVDALIGVRRGGGSNDFITFRCRRNDGTILAQT